MSARFICRVDDLAQSLALPSDLDVGMADFRRWWEEGWQDRESPIYLGVVPYQLTNVEREYLLRLEETGGARIALHGWDHHPHVLQRSDVKRGLEVFPDCRYHIVPFNNYNADTIQAIRDLTDPAVRPVLFGGLREHQAKRRPSDHPYGPAPTIVNGVVHLSAEWDFYAGQAPEVIERVATWPDPGYPIVLVLHYSWDLNQHSVEGPAGVRRLREALEGRIVSVDEAVAYAEANA